MKKNLFLNAMAFVFFCTLSYTSIAQIPELMWFKFNTSTGGVTPNDAPAATKVCPSGTIVGTQLSVSGTGQFGSGLAAAAMTSSSTDYVNTGWSTNLTGQSWTISIWLNIPNPPTTRYYFGDNTSGSFRCFTGGAASTGLRLTGPFTITTSTIQPGPCVVHYVYDNTALTVSAYINGVFNTSITLTAAPALAGAGPFKIGGYATGNGYEGIIDEFRMYNRALTQTEIANTWNQPLGTVCNAPTGLTATGITYNSANTSWGAVTGATGYEYAVTTSSTPPASGTATTGTSYNAPALTPGTTYYLHVRTQCATGFSTWTTYSFTTLSCTAPTGLTSSGVTSNSASFSWGAATGTGYEYAITTSSTPPASGTATTATSYNAIGLTSNTNYCLHVRTQCAAGVYSPWVNTCITTLAPPPCPGPDTLDVTNITSASADLSWNSLSTATGGYEYAVTQSATPPPTGTPTMGTTHSAGGLSFATQYYAHVRAGCTGGIFSAWKTVPFNTPLPPCDPPTASVSNITNEDADISWTAVPYAQSYQVAVFSNPNPPNISGIPTTATNYNATNLVSGKLYYVHLRTICAFDTSAWSTATFYSAIPASVSTVNGSSAISVYPNPVNDLLHIQLANVPGNKAQLLITDITGKVVTRVTEFTGNKTEINMAGMSQGIYLIKYVDEDRSQTVRITKE